MKKKLSFSLYIFVILFSISFSCKKENPVVSLQEILIKKTPDKTVYIEGENLDLTGLKITIIYINGDSIDVDFLDFEKYGLSCSVPNGDKLNESKLITITHTESGNTVDLSIFVCKYRIWIKTPPVKTIYYLGEKLDLTGLIVCILTDNGETKEFGFADFEKNGISCSPEDGVLLNNTNKEVQITYNSTGEKVSQPIKLNKLTIIANYTGPCQIFSIDLDGSDPVNLSNTTTTDQYPSVSPNGKQIVFQRQFPNYKRSIYLMDIDGKNQVELFEGERPSFSPDGKEITYIVQGKLYQYNLETKVNTCYGGWSVLEHCWTPDMKNIICSRNSGNCEIFDYNISNNTWTNLTNNSFNDSQPSVSPDGSKIAFTSNRDGDFEIYIMQIDGSKLIKVTDNTASDDYLPKWWPDGNKLTFLSNSVLYIVNTDGSDPQLIPKQRGIDSYCLLFQEL